MIDLKAHYLDLIGRSFAAHKIALLHRPDPNGSASKGILYAVPDDFDGSTKSEIVIGYDFGPDGFAFVAQFRDARAPFKWTGSYQDGLDDFWPALRKALTSNRLTNKGGERRAA